MKVTIKQLKEEAKLLRIDYSWSVEWQEHRVNLKISEGGTEESASYTDDATDALMTMRHMARERDIRHTVGELFELFSAMDTDSIEELEAMRVATAAIRKLVSGDTH